jgi:hypothetical protein
MPEDMRPYYLRLITSEQSHWEAPEDKRLDFELSLYMPSYGDVRIDNKIISEFEQYLEKSWGYKVLNVLRTMLECGTDVVNHIAFQIHDPQKQDATKDQMRPGSTQLGVLRQIANVRYTAAGTVKIEKFRLAGESIAHQATFTIKEGELHNYPHSLNDGERQFTVKRPGSNMYTVYVQSIGEPDREPTFTANWVAGKLGLFLLSSIGTPELVELHRGAETCRPSD